MEFTLSTTGVLTVTPCSRLYVGFPVFVVVCAATKHFLQTLYTYPGDFRGYKALLAAQYNGIALVSVMPSMYMSS